MFDHVQANISRKQHHPPSEENLEAGRVAQGVPFCTMRQSFDVGAAPKVKSRWWIDLDSRVNSVCSN